jgi:hypothetical protein
MPMNTALAALNDEPLVTSLFQSVTNPGASYRLYGIYRLYVQDACEDGCCSNDVLPLALAALDSRASRLISYP